MRTRRMGFVTPATLLFATSLLGCSGSPDESDATAGSTGMHLTLEVGATTGIEGVRYEFTEVDCTTGDSVGDALMIEKPLDDLLLPGGVPELEDAPLDSSSGHAFADHFVTLNPGCYDVVTTPVTVGDFVCHEAVERQVEVHPGEVTEVFLLNQCDGSAPGAIDAIAAFNHPPELLDVSFDESKFVPSCSEQLICATAADPENDPLDFTWVQTGGPAASGPAVVRMDVDESGATTQCVRFVPSEAGKVELSVTVHDVLHDNDAFSSPIHVEEWLANQGDPHDSSVSMELFFYATQGATPEAEICGDGVDNDCDGLIDDGCSCAPPLVSVCETSVEVVLMQDLSGSFSDDLSTVSALAPDLATTILDAHPDNLLGVASFIDKPFSPFGGSSDFVYRLDSALTDSASDFVDTISSLSVGYGNDGPEAQYEALFQLAMNANEVGFSPEAQHVVMLMTDADPHVAGDCSVPGYCTAANNGDGVVDATEDYPTLTQLTDALDSAHITPIFAVSGDSFVRGPYESLVASLGRGSVVELTSDSSNLIEALFLGLSELCHCE